MNNEATPTSDSSLLFPAIIAFTVAFATLLLQLVQTRIYGVVFWNHMVYFIISVALLGFGISGTWLAFGANSRVARVLTFRNAGLAFAASTIVACLFAPRAGISIAAFVVRSPRVVQLLLTYSVAVLPYFFGGWMLGSVFRDHAKRIHLLYFVDLVGAALGCLFFLALMQPLGAIHLVLICCAVVALPPLVADIRKRANIGMLVGVCAVLGVLAVNAPRLNAAIQPEATKAFNRLYQDMDDVDEKVWELSEWNPISRIDVMSAVIRSGKQIRFIGSKIILIDGDAWTPIATGGYWNDPIDIERVPVSGPEGPLYFKIGDLENVLVIGTGGGMDVAMALRDGAEHIDAVEINPTTYRIMKEEYREASDDLMYSKGVTSYNEEGRSFVRRSDKKYDLITITGVDTFAAINSGAYVLSENYLYTIEAFKDYLSHLTEDGILNITRWDHFAETPRLFVVCYEALREMGYENPERHIIVQGGGRATLLARLTPFSDEEIRGFGDNLTQGDEKMFYPSHPDHVPIAEIVLYVEARQAGTEEEFLDLLSYDISAVRDDSPFFFHFDKRVDLRRVFNERAYQDYIRGHWPSFILFSLLAFSLTAVCVFMFLPLAHRGRPPIPDFVRWLVFFSCLGISFIFVEIALMQRFALLLGHPSRSLALVLSSLLFFAGIGSYACGRFKFNLKVTLLILAVLLVATAYTYPIIIEAALGWSLFLRGVVAVALVAPVAFFMGMPFPTGLRHVSQSGEEAVPWMWGINGGTTVVGSILAIILAIWGSFTLVLLIATGGYLLALAMYVGLADR